MINKLKLIQNIGQFDSVTTGDALPFGSLVLGYAENGRGKTTLSAIMRSLGTGDPLLVSERHRLAAQYPPRIVIACSGGALPLVFENGAWSRTLTNVAVFDDIFVDENIYSGLTVAPEHRQKLHELVLGAQGVTLHHNLEQLVARIEMHNVELRSRAAAIPTSDMSRFSVDEFCALPANAEIDAAIQEVERKIAAVKEQDSVRRGAGFDSLSLPALDLRAITSILSQELSTLDAAAVERVKQHLTVLGKDSETWVAEGLRHVPNPLNGVACPFCLQDLAPSTIIGHYRAYFSAEYASLKRVIADSLANLQRTHGGDVPVAFERSVRIAIERRQFWGRFCEIPEISLDTVAISRAWKAARDGIITLLEKKYSAPLETIDVPEDIVKAVTAYEYQCSIVAALNASLQQANTSIRLVKEQAAAGSASVLESDRALLRATKARHSPLVAALCTSYLAEKTAKAQTVSLREQAKVALEQYRTSVLPAYEQKVNVYLQRFNAGFRIGDITSVTGRSGTACNYSVLINNTAVSIAGGTAPSGAPSFRNTLSAGDRNTLALAFFLSSIDHDPDLATKTVVIDDPVSSLDEHRSLTTVQEIRQLATRAGQVIVLSHEKEFLTAIWNGLDAIARAQCTTIQIVQDGQGSSLAVWDAKADAITEYDRNHALLREYNSNGSGVARDVARAIRPVLECFMRVSRPANFLPGASLGNGFLSECMQRVGRTDEIFDAARIQELREILEYGHRFHHETNPAWQTETINRGELGGFVSRTLNFVR